MAAALFSGTQLGVLTLLFGQPERLFGIVELISLVGAGRGAVQREVQRLVESGLVTVERLGRDKRYRANTSAPIFDELRGIIEKLTGIAAVIGDAVRAMPADIRFAVLYGSVAKQRDTATSDIDVLLISDDLTLEDAFEGFASAERKLGRRVSPTVYTRAEFLRARQSGSPFLIKVLEGDHVVLLGSEDAVASSG